MDLESVYALMERFEHSSLTGLELEQNGTRLRLDKTVAVAAAPAAAVAAVSAVPPAAVPDVPEAIQQKEEGEYIKAPLVGTFYAAAGPESEPFVKVGDQVKKGQTVCILEAMKMMSEIPAPMDCVIEEVLLENGSLAGYEAPLFRVRRGLMFQRVLIANRGEIAMRILRACREIGVDAVTVYSAADADSIHVQLSPKAVCIGPAKASESYLNMDALLTVAKETGCDAIHPGYGFLSENAEFAQRCADLGLTFIGPSGAVIQAMGNKAAARDLMIKSGVPVVPGSDGPVETAQDAKKIAEEIGYPVLVKASAGGGGRGMRRVDQPEELAAKFEEARAEALACFGDGQLYLEKLILHPKHIEFQILADRRGNVIHLGERDCSIQRKNQKLVEESPSKVLTPELRERMGAAAVAAARAAGYENAGTIEFVVDQEGNFYFIEMNTRIQVEHPVTEMVTGLDLVREQLRIAAGLPLSLTQNEVTLRGHAIECRINAEDFKSGFRPCPGTTKFLHFPGGPGVRVDSLLYNGYSVSPYYDSLVAKVIVHAPTRLEAIRRMRRALEELIIDGYPTTADFCHLILYHPDFVKGQYNTGFLPTHMDELLNWDKED